jgi:hypothetical protein
MTNFAHSNSTLGDEVPYPRAASAGQRSTATQVHQCSTKNLAGIRLYSSRARAVAGVQSDSNFASAAVSSLATAARSAAGSRSGSGTTGCCPSPPLAAPRP